MTPPPDPFTLDAMVLGTDAGVLEPWLGLLSAPDAARRWQEAVMRRRSLDGLALALRQRPWLAPLLRTWEQGYRRLVRSSTWSIPLDQGPPSLPDLSGPSPRRTVMHAGRVEVVELSQGETIHFPVPDDLAVIVLTDQGVGTEPLQAWTLEAGEAPVVLVVMGPDRQTPLATLVLQEREPEKNSP